MDLKRQVVYLTMTASSALLPATAASPHLDVPAFMESIVAPLRAEHCAKAVADYASRFEPIFRQWKLDNEQRIVAGRRFLESDAERSGRPLASFTRSLEQTTVLGMSAMSESELRAFCDASLLVLSSKP